jgi:hypothetical protein
MTIAQRLRLLLPGFVLLAVLALVFVGMMFDHFDGNRSQLPLFYLCVLLGPVYLLFLWMSDPSSWSGPSTSMTVFAALTILGVFARPMFQVAWARIVTRVAFGLWAFFALIVAGSVG